MGTSLVVQWLRLHASTPGGVGWIPGQGTKNPACCVVQPKKIKTETTSLTWLLAGVRRSTSKITHTAAGRPSVLTGYSAEMSDPCLRGLSIGQFTRGKLASLRGSPEENKREGQQDGSQSLCDLISKVISHPFCHILLVKSVS